RKIYISISLLTIILISIVVTAFQNKPQQLSAPLLLPQVVSAKKSYVFTQALTSKFRNDFKIENAIFPDTTVILFEFIPVGGWLKKLSDSKLSLNYYATAYNKGKLFIAGGRDISGKVVNTFYEYDLAGQQWINRPSMKTAREFFALESHDNFIYAIGGTDKTEAEVYDMSSNQWTTKPLNYTGCSPMKEIICYENIDTLFFMFNNNGEMQILNIKNMTVQKGPTPPFKMKNFDACTYNKKIYISAGYDESGINANVYCYSTADSLWSSIGKVGSPRCLSGLVYFGSMILHIGGSFTIPSQKCRILSDTYIFRLPN
ncbi:MAG TPA: hypothetical protein VIO15_00450, partial [Bacteroidales bacterium]